MSYAARIRAARAYADLTQEELAAELGVEVQTIKRRESGKMDPKRQELLAIAAVTGVPAGFLIDGFASVIAVNGGRISTEVAAQLAAQTAILKDIQDVVAVLKGATVVSEPAAASDRKVAPAPRTTPDRLPQRRGQSAPTPKPSRTADASTDGKDQDRRHGAA